MRYSDLESLESKCDHTPKYRLCYRENASKSGKFKGVHKGMHTTFTGVFNFALISAEKVTDIFSEDGKYMLVECIDGDERVILPAELKKMLSRDLGAITSEMHKFDNADGTMYESCSKILNAINTALGKPCNG